MRGLPFGGEPGLPLAHALPYLALFTKIFKNFWIDYYVGLCSPCPRPFGRGRVRWGESYSLICLTNKAPSLVISLVPLIFIRPRWSK